MKLVFIVITLALTACSSTSRHENSENDRAPAQYTADQKFEIFRGFLVTSTQRRVQALHFSEPKISVICNATHDPSNIDTQAYAHAFEDLLDNSQMTERLTKEISSPSMLNALRQISKRNLANALHAACQAPAGGKVGDNEHAVLSAMQAIASYYMQE